jgi:hypothetical protein
VCVCVCLSVCLSAKTKIIQKSTLLEGLVYSVKSVDMCAGLFVNVVFKCNSSSLMFVKGLVSLS